MFEELKRKPNRGISIDDIFYDNANFSNEEIKILEYDDFVVNGDNAKCIEKFGIFEIIKEIDDSSIKYLLIIKDKDGKELRRKRFSGNSRSSNLSLLNLIIDICAKYNEKLLMDVVKEIDPFNEENWGEDNPEITATKRYNRHPLDPFERPYNPLVPRSRPTKSPDERTPDEIDTARKHFLDTLKASKNKKPVTTTIKTLKDIVSKERNVQDDIERSADVQNEPQKNVQDVPEKKTKKTKNNPWVPDYFESWWNTD